MLPRNGSQSMDDNTVTLNVQLKTNPGVFSATWGVSATLVGSSTEWLEDIVRGSTVTVPRVPEVTLEEGARNVSAAAASGRVARAAPDVVVSPAEATVGSLPVQTSMSVTVQVPCWDADQPQACGADDAASPGDYQGVFVYRISITTPAGGDVFSLPLLVAVLAPAVEVQPLNLLERVSPGDNAPIRIPFHVSNPGSAPATWRLAVPSLSIARAGNEGSVVAAPPDRYDFAAGSVCWLRFLVQDDGPVAGVRNCSLAQAVPGLPALRTTASTCVEGVLAPYTSTTLQAVALPAQLQVGLTGTDIAFAAAGFGAASKAQVSPWQPPPPASIPRKFLSTARVSSVGLVISLVDLCPAQVALSPIAAPPDGSTVTRVKHVTVRSFDATASLQPELAAILHGNVSVSSVKACAGGGGGESAAAVRQRFFDIVGNASQPSPSWVKLRFSVEADVFIAGPAPVGALNATALPISGITVSPSAIGTISIIATHSADRPIPLGEHRMTLLLVFQSTQGSGGGGAAVSELRSVDITVNVVPGPASKLGSLSIALRPRVLGGDLPLQGRVAAGASAEVPVDTSALTVDTAGKLISVIQLADSFGFPRAVGDDSLLPLLQGAGNRSVPVRDPTVLAVRRLTSSDIMGDAPLMAALQCAWSPQTCPGGGAPSVVPQAAAQAMLGLLSSAPGLAAAYQSVTNMATPMPPAGGEVYGVFLRPRGSGSMAVQVWSAAVDAEFAQATRSDSVLPAQGSTPTSPARRGLAVTANMQQILSINESKVEVDAVPCDSLGLVELTTPFGSITAPSMTTAEDGITCTCRPGFVRMPSTPGEVLTSQKLRCMPCPAGFYSARATLRAQGAVGSCLPCPDNSFALAGAATCTTCPVTSAVQCSGGMMSVAGGFRLSRWDGAGVSAPSSPELQLWQAALELGWSAPANSSVPGEGERFLGITARDADAFIRAAQQVMLPCPNPFACVPRAAAPASSSSAGGNETQVAPAERRRGTCIAGDQGRSFNCSFVGVRDSTCAEGHDTDSFLCVRCAEGYHHFPPGAGEAGSCVACGPPGRNAGILVGITAVGLGLVAVILYSWNNAEGGVGVAQPSVVAHVSARAWASSVAVTSALHLVGKGSKARGGKDPDKQSISLTLNWRPVSASWVPAGAVCLPDADAPGQLSISRPLPPAADHALRVVAGMYLLLFLQLSSLLGDVRPNNPQLLSAQEVLGHASSLVPVDSFAMACLSPDSVIGYVRLSWTVALPVLSFLLGALATAGVYAWESRPRDVPAGGAAPAATVTASGARQEPVQSSSDKLVHRTAKSLAVGLGLALLCLWCVVPRCLSGVVSVFPSVHVTPETEALLSDTAQAANTPLHSTARGLGALIFLMFVLLPGAALAWGVRVASRAAADGVSVQSGQEALTGRLPPKAKSGSAAVSSTSVVVSGTSSGAKHSGSASESDMDAKASHEAIAAVPAATLRAPPSMTVWSATALLWGFYRPGMQGWSALWCTQMLLLAMTPAFTPSFSGRCFIATFVCLVAACTYELAAPHDFARSLLRTNARVLDMLKRQLERFKALESTTARELGEEGVPLLCSCCGFEFYSVRSTKRKQAAAKPEQEQSAAASLFQSMQEQQLHQRLVQNPALEWVSSGRGRMAPILHHTAIVTPSTTRSAETSAQKGAAFTMSASTRHMLRVKQAPEGRDEPHLQQAKAVNPMLLKVHGGQGKQGKSTSVKADGAPAAETHALRQRRADLEAEHAKVLSLALTGLWYHRIGSSVVWNLVLQGGLAYASLAWQAGNRFPSVVPRGGSLNPEQLNTAVHVATYGTFTLWWLTVLYLTVLLLPNRIRCSILSCSFAVSGAVSAVVTKPAAFVLWVVDGCPPPPPPPAADVQKGRRSSQRIFVQPLPTRQLTDEDKGRASTLVKGPTDTAGTDGQRAAKALVRQDSDSGRISAHATQVRQRAVKRDSDTGRLLRAVRNSIVALSRPTSISQGTGVDEEGGLELLQLSKPSQALSSERRRELLRMSTAAGKSAASSTNTSQRRSMASSRKSLLKPAAGAASKPARSTSPRSKRRPNRGGLW